MKHAVIADVHGCMWQLRAGLSALGVEQVGDSWQSDGTHKVVSVGDLNDYRGSPHSLVSSLDCLLTMWALEESGIGITIDSNHNLKLVKALEGKTGEGQHSQSLRGTLQELKDREGTYDLDGLRGWLSSRPPHYSFEEDGKQYVVAHAYYSSTQKNRQVSLYGPTDKSKHRTQWWEMPREGEPFTVVGHYHRVWINQHSIGIDGGAGQGGPLNIYVPSGQSLSVLPTGEVVPWKITNRSKNGNNNYESL